ncbi:Hypothetical predicted protein, partial [Mytilus galloprovincialis]
MNVIKSFFELNWTPFLEKMCEIMQFTSDNAKNFAKTCKDHHVAWQLLLVFHTTSLKEMVVPFVRYMMKQGECRHQINISYFIRNSCRQIRDGHIYICRFFRFSQAIINLRMGVRRNNSCLVQSAKFHLKELFYGRSHPHYRNIELFDTLQYHFMPDEVKNIWDNNTAFTVSGHNSKGQDLDFLLEEKNRAVKQFIPSGSIPSNETWDAICCGSDVMDWTRYKSETDVYISDLSLPLTDIVTKSPVYYVSLMGDNGAGQESTIITSTPIVVVNEDKPGIVIDGAEGTDNLDLLILDDDTTDYQLHPTVVTVQFDGFESHLHGVTEYKWAVGTTPGGEDVMSFIPYGLIHSEEVSVKGNGITSSGYAQANLDLKSGVTYYSTVRAITNVGSVLESVSDGFIVDTSPPIISLDRLTDQSSTDTNIGAGSTLYEKSADTLFASWHYNDTESSIRRAWYSVGTYPFAEDVSPITEVEVSSGLHSVLPLASVIPDTTGKPNIISIWAENNAGTINKLTSGSVIIDTTPPIQGVVTCPKYIGAKVPVKCSWSGFQDRESPIQRFLISLGSEEGLTDIFEDKEVSGFTSSYSIDNAGSLMTHGQTYYLTVTAVNSVHLMSYAFSGPIAIDTTPPQNGKVIDLHTTYRMDVSNNTATVLMNSRTCSTDQECDALDATCSESLTSVSLAWQPFTDEQSGIKQYEVAIGITPGGGQIKPFIRVPVDTLQYTVNGLNLHGLKKIYVSVRGTNGAGLSSVGTSNGVHMSYLSQGLPPLSHIGVYDVLQNSHGDVDFQESYDTYRASWDMSGDPCPVVRYEWQIQRLDGKVVMPWLDMGIKTSGMNDELQMLNGELYYSLLRVTNALDYTYILRSNGVTIKQDPLMPGKVFDGDVDGYDLNFLRSKAMVTANWDGFGLPVNTQVQVDIISGNPGVHVNQENIDYQDKNQDVVYYEVALGTDRRFPKTRDNIVSWTNVAKNTSVTFYDLELVPSRGMYYFTVKAYSASYSVAMVTSNGFRVGYDGGVSVGMINVEDYINTDKYVDVQFEGFYSKLDILMYYVAVSDYRNFTGSDCKQYIDGGKATDEEKAAMFNVYPVTNINQNTFYRIQPLNLQLANNYFIWVMGTDKSGECSMTSREIIVDTTYPVSGELACGPDYNMAVTYTPESTSLTVSWEKYKDPESDIKSYDISLWFNSSCSDDNTQSLLVDWIELSSNYSQFTFTELELKQNIPYIVKFRVTNLAGLSINEESSPILYDLSTPTAGKVVDGSDYLNDRVWFSSSTTITGSIIHLATPRGLPCPTQSISMVNDSGWKILKQIGLKDPSGQPWSLLHREENVRSLVYDDAVSIKLARDVKKERMFSGSYYRTADFENGGTYQISVKAADGEGIAVTGIMLWDGPEEEIATYDYLDTEDWTQSICDCCLQNPVPQGCSMCNCSEYNHTETTTVISPITRPPYDIVNNADESDVTSPIDTTRPTSQTSCGIQIYSGSTPHIVTWCRSYNDSQRLMKTKMDLNFDPTTEYHNYKFMVTPQKYDEISINWCITVFVDDGELTEICGIEPPSISTKLVLHVWNRNNYVPEITDLFNVFSTKAYFKNLVMPPKVGSLCRYGNPFRGGTNPVIKYEAAIGTDQLTTDISDFSEVYRPCIPCYNQCSKYNCDSNCDPEEHLKVTFSLTDLNLQPYIVDQNDTGHEYNKTAAYYLTVRAVLGSGLTAGASSDGFYVDLTPPQFDSDVMNQIYIDVSQGEFTPVKYQASNDTIKVFWYCYDEQSVVALLVPPNVNLINTTVIGAEDFDHPVTPADAKRGTDPTSVGFTFTLSEDESVTRYDICMGSSVDNDDIFPCTWISINISGTVVIKNGSLYMNQFKLYKLSELRRDQANITTDAFHMEPGRTLFVTLRACNDAFLCNNKSLGSVTMMDDKAVLKTSVSGEPIEMEHNIKSKRRKRSINVADSLIITSPEGLEAGQSIILQPLDGTDLTTSYASDSSPQFRSYIVNPDDTSDMVDRILYKRLHESQFSFAVIPVGHLSMPGPLQITYQDTVTDRDKTLVLTHWNPGKVSVTDRDKTLVLTHWNPGKDSVTDRDKTLVLTHWNPELQQWELSSKTCGDQDGTEVTNTNGTVTVMVCSTSSSNRNKNDDGRRKRSTTDPNYLSSESQFSMSVVTTSVYNTPPRLVSPDTVTMAEDEGTLQYLLEAVDDEGDSIIFYLDNTTYIMGEPILHTNGLLLYTPCVDCSGTEIIRIILSENQTDPNIPVASLPVTLTVTITSQNDHPEIFITQYGQSMLHQDPSEPVIVYLEQMQDYNENIWSDQFTAVIGGYDVEKEDNLSMVISYPNHGNLTVTNEETILLRIDTCQEQSL